MDVYIYLFTCTSRYRTLYNLYYFQVNLVCVSLHAQLLS